MAKYDNKNITYINKINQSEMLLEEFLNFPKKVQEIILLPFLDQVGFPTIAFDKTIKSPIEKIFITAFDYYTSYDNKKKIYLFSQQEIKIKDKTYYPDFLFEYDEYVNNYNTDSKIIIECDGYEFHQKTKEQVQRDNEREYDLKMAGYEILRFSGTQIYKNPIKCAEDTYNYIISKIKE